MPDADTLHGRVQRVKDGDTVVVTTGSDTVTVRVWGIDAPETGQPYGPAATKGARQLIGGERVRVHVQDTGPYGRYIARVQIETEDGPVDLAQSLVVSGLAWHSRRYATSEALVQCEEEARSEGAGLWSQNDPTPPWEFRRADQPPSVWDSIKKGLRWGRWISRLMRRL
ncbi:thermonuclease family protein [Salinibacter altiplanensis]|uniref:thermonuclease family protein n=1 Tax=Salinibacter altiplanensis TaxID=1803181 RepID=UPI000C9F9399|nr:thermonuclease family protein [Salinibacter altiplanensis]